jgi:hypothetical protein
VGWRGEQLLIVSVVSILTFVYSQSGIKRLDSRAPRLTGGSKGGNILFPIDRPKIE